MCRWYEDEMRFEDDLVRLWRTRPILYILLSAANGPFLAYLQGLRRVNKGDFDMSGGYRRSGPRFADAMLVDEPGICAGNRRICYCLKIFKRSLKQEFPSSRATH